MNRRNFIHSLLSGVAGSISVLALQHELDIDRLLWVPGQKTIFLPPVGVSYSKILELEIERIALRIPSLFEQDNTFYEAIRRK